MNNMNKNEKDILLDKIRAHSFVAVEVNLFLDSHPDNEAALKYYTENKKALDALVAEYEEKYGPLTAGSDKAVKDGKWQWVSTPWPWQEG